jgi:hypothetical protein
MGRGVAQAAESDYRIRGALQDIRNGTARNMRIQWNWFGIGFRAAELPASARHRFL